MIMKPSIEQKSVGHVSNSRSSRRSKRTVAESIMLAGLLSISASPATAQLTIPGADGSDGAFSPSGTNVVVDLSQAATGAWDSPSPMAGKGVYDATKWAVVFKYTSVNIPSGTTVRFLNHSKRAPVVWLVSGDVTINGTVNLSGENGKFAGTVATESGPGGFRGGIGTESSQRLGSAGFGPGGAQLNATVGGSYASPGDGASAGATYGNSQVLPLLGGSGGGGTAPGGGNSYASGGAGGGGLMLAATGNVTLNGVLLANGGTPVYAGGAGGSGGAFRIIANRVAGTGIIEARGIGGTFLAGGGNGRVRIETPSFSNGLNIYPATIAVLPDNPPLLWTSSSTPQVQVTSVTGAAVPTDPISNLGLAGADVVLTNATNVVILVQAANVATNGSVMLRIVPQSGYSISTNAAFLSGDINASVWRVQTVIPKGFCAIQARAVTP